MNIPILTAGILSLLAFFAHAFIGDKENKQLKPEPSADEKAKEAWVQVRSGWHWVSVDLFLSGILLIVLATSDLIEEKQIILLLLSIYFFVTGLVWLGTVFLSRNNNKQLLVLGQWVFCFIVSALICYGNLADVKM